MVLKEVEQTLTALSFPMTIESALLRANERILHSHQAKDKDSHKGDDVGGACFAFCQLQQGGINLLLGGDAFALVTIRRGPVFLTGFDKVAFEIEKQDQEAFTKRKEQAGGNIGAAWDLYWPHYKAKRIFCKNRNIGSGGDASLNGDPALAQC